MYKCLSPSAIGILARQSELLEIALTHKFQGLEIDINEVLKRAQSTSAKQACRYLASAQVRIGGFELPIRWQGDDAEFKADLSQLGTLLEICATLNADRCFTTIRPTCDQRPFHENFQFHVDRLGQVADALAPANMKLGLNFLAAASDRADGGFEFIHQVDPTVLLLNGVQRDNVGLMLDTWRWWVGGGDVEKIRSLRGEQILGVHIADVPASYDATTITEEERLLPAEGGGIDFASLFSTLEDIGYDGPLVLAPSPAVFKGQKREAIVSQASALLDTLLSKVGVEKPVVAASE
jgi:sugar phosphate isomerase/epimerase